MVHRSVFRVVGFYSARFITCYLSNERLFFLKLLSDSAFPRVCLACRDITLFLVVFLLVRIMRILLVRDTSSVWLPFLLLKQFYAFKCTFHSCLWLSLLTNEPKTCEFLNEACWMEVYSSQETKTHFEKYGELVIFFLYILVNQDFRPVETIPGSQQSLFSIQLRQCVSVT